MPRRTTAGMSASVGADSEAAELARDMLAAGVVIADYELRFERSNGLVDDDFHTEWEAASSGWWELAARYDHLWGRRPDAEKSAGHAASVARMFRLPPGGLL